MKFLPLIFIGILIGLTSCNGNNFRKKIVINFNFPEIYDTVKKEKITRESKWLESANYNPLYIGKNKRKIYIHHNNLEKKYFAFDYRGKFPKPDSIGLMLLVDTSKVVFNKLSFFVVKDAIFKSEYYSAFPVYVINISKDTFNIGEGYQLPIIMEAINKNGVWKPIEMRYFHSCGTGLNEIILPPNEMVVTSAPKFKGDFKTKLRLRYNSILSNEFYGTIYRSQFESFSLE